MWNTTTCARRKQRSKTYTTGRMSWVPNSPSTPPNCYHHHITSVSAPPPPTQAMGLNLQSVIPFPSADSPITEELPPHVLQDRVAPVQKREMASRRFLWPAHDSQRTSAAGLLHLPDWEPEFVDRPGERRRSQSFDASQCALSTQESYPSRSTVTP
jgi:hypothetical protein